jgi:iron complex outermembrane receptor protein
MALVFKNAVLVLVLLVIVPFCNAQDCAYNLSGKVVDKQQHPIAGCVVRLLNTPHGAVTDTDGFFLIPGSCSGHSRLSFSAIGYRSVTYPIAGQGNEVVNQVMSAETDMLQEVTINAEKMQDLHTVTTAELSGLALLQKRGLSLGESLKELPGLNSIQTGPTLSKPIIHGLYSNRILLINDGVRQEGQQWGSEHAPEIDPFIANRITVVKGAASVRYGSDAIGGVILLSPDELPTTPGINGEVYLVGASNGQMGAISALLQGAFDRKLKGLSWRVQGTLKEAGNFRTPRYYLLNTGQREGDFSANICYRWKRFEFDIYYSQFNTEVGIYAGAESGSLKDLLASFQRSTPALPSYFTYKIDRSYQNVYHDLTKAKITYKLLNKGKLELTFARQNDVRKEYDADIPYGPNPMAQYSIPQLSFQLITHTVDIIYTQRAKNRFSGSIGFTGASSGNIQGGIRYLLPNFRDYNGGIFGIERYTWKKLTFEAGIRYDYRWFRVYERDQTTLAVYNTTYQYNNTSGTLGCTYHFNDHLLASANVGTGWRAPSINEMYIDGVHFSDASYEIGDSTLKSERSINTGLSVNYTSDKLRFAVDGYYNQINNYIFELPVFPPRQLASGTFPTFLYRQADVKIYGVDVILQYDFSKQFTFQSKTTVVRGYNELIHDWLVYMPSDRFQNGIEYHFQNIGKLKEPYVSFENLTVVRQTRIPIRGDYTSSPGGYSLFNVNTGFTFPIKHNTLNVNFAVNNLTNLAYRDYLDHFRYYADELGINYILRLKYSF